MYVIFLCFVCYSLFCGIMQVIFKLYIFSRMFEKRELRENMYNTKISTFTVYLFFVIVCFVSNQFGVAVLPHRPGEADHLLLLRRETTIPGVAPFSL